MMLAATQGTEITLTIQGAEEEEAMTALLKLIAEGFGEPR
jgi:phosphotransferase system HPr (HPr) family protein